MKTADALAVLLIVALLALLGLVLWDMWTVMAQSWREVFS